MRADYSLNIVGSIIAKPSLLAECDLSPDEFLNEECGLIYQSILDLNATQSPIDVMTVSDHLEKTTGRNYVMTVGRAVMDFAHAQDLKIFERYVTSLRLTGQAARAKGIAETLLKSADSGPEAIDSAIRDLMELTITRKNHECGAVEAMNAVLDHMDDVINGKADTGIKTGIRLLDEYLGGLHKSDLIIVGARPAIGKTAFMLNMAISAGAACGIISTEQPREQVGARIMSTDARVALRKMRNADLEQGDWSRFANTISKLKNRVIRINDKPNSDINEITRQARKWKQVYDIKVLYLDYIQHIPGDRRLPRHEQVEEIVKQLKNVARELNIPVVALAQVSRKVEDRAANDKRPRMADLKDSGAIEQEADQIMFLYRDEVYNDNIETKGIMEIDVQKNRHGPTGMFKVSWQGEFVSIKDLDSRYDQTR